LSGKLDNLKLALFSNIFWKRLGKSRQIIVLNKHSILLHKAENYNAVNIMTWDNAINVGKIVNYGKGDESDKTALFVN
jgi:hypothetical protein